MTMAPEVMTRSRYGIKVNLPYDLGWYVVSRYRLLRNASRLPTLQRNDCSRYDLRHSKPTTAIQMLKKSLTASQENVDYRSRKENKLGWNLLIAVTSTRLNNPWGIPGRRQYGGESEDPSKYREEGNVKWHGERTWWFLTEANTEFPEAKDTKSRCRLNWQNPVRNLNNNQAQ